MIVGNKSETRTNNQLNKKEWKEKNIVTRYNLKQEKVYAT